MQYLSEVEARSETLVEIPRFDASNKQLASIGSRPLKTISSSTAKCSKNSNLEIEKRTSTTNDAVALISDFSTLAISKEAVPSFA